MRLLFSLLLSLSLNASYINWQGDYESAHREALAQNKSLLILLVNKNQKATQKLLQETFMNQPYIEEINKNFISILVTKGQKSSYPIELLYTLEYPTLFFLDKYELYSCTELSTEISPKTVSKKLKECF